MANELNGQRVAFLVAQEGVEEPELTAPWEAVEKAGGRPELIAPEMGEVQAFKHHDRGSTFPVDRTLDEARAEEYAAVVLPGGVINADLIRTDPRAVRFVQEAFMEGKPAGVICHGPWLLVEAGLARGRRMTSWPSLQTDIRNGGGEWVDEEVVVDHGLVSSRKPDDLPAFCAKTVEEIAEGAHRFAGAGTSASGNGS